MDTVNLSALVFGTMGYGSQREAELIRLIHAALDAGMTTLDTAPLYGFGSVETIVGKAIQDRKANVQVVSKCGIRWDGEGSRTLFEAEIDGRHVAVRTDSRPASIISQVQQSLSRLGIDALDVMLIHQLDHEVPVEAAIESLLECKSRGLVKEIGVSNFPSRELNRARRAACGELQYTQNIFNLLNQHESEAARIHAQHHHIEFMAYSPLAQGILAGRQLTSGSAPDDWRRHGFEFQAQRIEVVNRFLQDVALPIAHQHDLSLAQLVLAWTLKQPGICQVVVGGTTEAQIRDNANAAEARISAESLAELNAHAAAIARPRERKSIPAVVGRIANSIRRRIGRI